MRPEILNNLFASVQSLSGIGTATADHLKRLGCERVIDLCWHMPASVMNRRYIERLSQAKIGEIITIPLFIREHHPPRSSFGKKPYKIKCQDDYGHFVEITFFHTTQDQMLRKFPADHKIFVSGKFEQYNNIWQMAHPDFVGSQEESKSWIGCEPVYPLTYGLNQKYLHKNIKHALAKVPVLSEWISPQRLTQTGWPLWKDALLKLHDTKSQNDLEPSNPARRRLAYDELLANQLALLLVRSKNKQINGRKFAGDGSLRRKVLAALSFELTGAQQRAMSDILQDMHSDSRMVRLLQGDVGSGKTIVAMLTMLNAVESGAQAAILAPTEILAQQHFSTMQPWAQAAGVKIALLTRTVSGKSQLLKQIEDGEIDIIIGTHAIIQESVNYKDLGVAIIDEQHRFGVDQRLALSQKGDRVDVLVMTATPIPRTLMMTNYGDLDVSVLNEKPAGRQEIKTTVMPLTRLEEVVEHIKQSVEQGKKIYWVCPLIEESEALDLAAAQDRFNILSAIMPGKVGLVHGKIPQADKDAVMSKFLAGELQVLVATTVIEVGVHVPDATIMVIEHAELFGLSQLHQLRGRIGRGSEQSNCLLLYSRALTTTAKARLKIMRETNDGFLISEEDLKLRGSGEVLGSRQSGLPSFKVADLETHLDLLSLARNDALTIMQEDPKLQSEQGKALRTLLYLFEKDRTISYMTGG